MKRVGRGKRRFGPRWPFLTAASLPALLAGQAAHGAAAPNPNLPADAPANAAAAATSALQAPPGPIVAAPQPSINPTGRTIDLIVPLRSTTPLGQVGVRLTPDGRVLVSAADLGAAVSRIATPETIAAISGANATDGYVPIEALAQAGLTLSYDPAQLELVLTVSATARVRGLIDLGFQSGPRPVQPDDSAPFALYLSYNASLDWVHQSDSGRTGLRPPRVDMNLNGRVGQLISFQNELSYDGDAAKDFVRLGSRLIYDRPDWRVRFTLGDQLPVQTGFQDATDVLGIGASHLVQTFQPDQVLASSSSRSVTLREPATVTVVVNGVPQRTLRLDSGVYDLNDLPLTSGANSVQLIIEDAAGGRRVVSFDFFQDLQLLQPGIDEYDVQVGIRSRVDQLTRRYFTNEPVITGFYRRGVNPQLTLGANIQATNYAQMVGFEGTLGTPIGLFSLETAFSNIDGAGFGHSERLQYRYSTPLQQLQGERRIDVLIEHRSRNFGSTESFIPNNLTAWRLTARYAQPLTRLFSVGFGIDYDRNRDQADRYGLSAFATWRIGQRTTVTGSAGYDSRDHAVVGFSLVHRFGRSSTASAQYDSREGQASATYSYEPYRTLDVFAINGQISRTPDDIGVNATATYRSNRGDIELAHRATYDLGDNDISGEVTSLRMRGTIAFADGRVAVGRYLTDSFAIVAAHPSLNTAQVSAPVFLGDRIAGREIARTGALGPALVPLSSYSTQSVPFEVPNAPAGYDLGAGNFPVFPWLNSGRVFVVGSEFNTTALGTLENERGEPMALLIGTARRLNDAHSPTIQVFTNRAGRFGATGLAPGTWRISFADGRYYDVQITEAQGSLANFGTLRPTGRQENQP